MKTQAENTKEQHEAPIQRVDQEPGTGGTAVIEDNRPSTVYQRKLRETMDAAAARKALPVQRKANTTGLPDNLKAGVENLSGYSMDDVKVHYNSSKPAQLQAHAYAQGTDIHIAPGQEKHLPHEAWHVVQQKQGRVAPTMQLKGKVNINDDAGLEKEADVMGGHAEQLTVTSNTAIDSGDFVFHSRGSIRNGEVIQGKVSATNFKELLDEQQNVQEEALKEPEKYKEKVTTVGFEHEFCEMMDGPLRGSAHIEIAKSQETMPYKGFGFVLETDAQNALELVSPPFLVDTLNGAPIPDPNDIEKIDKIIIAALMDTVSGGATIGEFIKSFKSNPGLNFIIGTPASDGSEVSIVEIDRQNMSANTDKTISEENNRVDEATITQIKLKPFDRMNGSKKSASTQVNFATDATTYDSLQHLESRRYKHTASFEEVEGQLTSMLYKKAFEGMKIDENLYAATEGMRSQLEGATIVNKAYGNMINGYWKMIKKRIPADKEKEKEGSRGYITMLRNLTTMKRSISNIASELDLPQSSVKGLKGTINHEIKRIRESFEPNRRTVELLLGITEGLDEHDKGYVTSIKVVEEKVKSYISNLHANNEAIPPQAPQGDKANANLRIFINVLSRTLAGQLGVMFQGIVEQAQEARYKGTLEAMKGTNDAALLASRVKDVHYVWIKDTIMNIGLGLLTSEQWRYINSTLLPELQAFKLPEEKQYGVGTTTVNGKDLTEQIHKSVKTLEHHIISIIGEEQSEATAEVSGTLPNNTKHIGIDKRPDLFTHEPSLIGARQDTHLPTSGVQMEEIWADRRLHVVESRGQLSGMLATLRSLTGTGEQEQGGGEGPTGTAVPLQTTAVELKEKELVNFVPQHLVEGIRSGRAIGVRFDMQGHGPVRLEGKRGNVYIFKKVD